MAVYDGVPSIRLEGDEERALALIPEAKALLYKVHAFMRAAEVNTFSMSRRVDDDSSIFALAANGQNILHISVAPRTPGKIDEPEQPIITGEGTAFPDFYSGMVFGGFLEERTRVDDRTGELVRYTVCVRFSPTNNCVATHPELVLGRQEVTRLAVRPWGAFDELNNQAGSPVFSQYVRLVPSMYSGKMKKVVQVAMGLGRISAAKMRNPANPTSRYAQDVNDHGVQIRYDWRFSRTHGITTAADGRLWLVEIGQNRGVLAMPLPTFPGSERPAFRERALERGDTAMVRAIDELGCLPTGEAFPNTVAALNAAIDRGDVLRLVTPSQLAEFYTCSPYSTAHGWAFSDGGREAHNTAYYYGGEGFQRGVWYQVNINIGATNPDRLPNQPIASASAELRKNNEGYIYTPPVLGRNRFVPIKFYEPMLPGLLSHEGVSSIEAANLPVPRVDVPMFVAFVDGELKLVKFFRNPKQDNATNIDDPRYPGECLYDNQWLITESFGIREFPSMMYSNEFDDRRAVQQSVITTDIQSVPFGVDTPIVSDFLDYPRVARVTRAKVYKRTTIVDRRFGEQVASAVAIPSYSREAYYYATGSKFSSRTGYTNVAFDSLMDPNTAYTWRCFPQGGGSPPWPPGFGCATDVCGGYCSPGGVGAPRERRVVCLTYEPSGPCSDFADSGAWLNTCQDVDPFIGQPALAKPSSHVDRDLGTDEKASLFLISPGYHGPLSIAITPGQFFDEWMRPSPDPETQDIQQISALHSAIGEDALVYSTGLSTYTLAKKTYGLFPEPINPADGFPTFVGVNN